MRRRVKSRLDRFLGTAHRHLTTYSRCAASRLARCFASGYLAFGSVSSVLLRYPQWNAGILTGKRLALLMVSRVLAAPVIRGAIGERSQAALESSRQLPARVGPAVSVDAARVGKAVPPLRAFGPSGESRGGDVERTSRDIQNRTNASGVFPVGRDGLSWQSLGSGVEFRAGEDVQEWRFTDWRITQLTIDSASVRLLAWRLEGAAEIRIGVPFRFRDGDWEKRVDPENTLELATILPVVDRPLEVIRVQRTGQLHLRLGGRMILQVEPDPDLEAWEIGGAGVLEGLSYLSGPGGGSPWGG